MTKETDVWSRPVTQVTLWRRQWRSSLSNGKTARYSLGFATTGLKQYLLVMTESSSGQSYKIGTVRGRVINIAYDESFKDFI